MRYRLEDFTLDEKMRLICGRDMWSLETFDGKLPELTVADGPSGLRRKEAVDAPNGPKYQIIPGTTAMPSTATLANTWNPQMAFECAETIADEFIENGRDVMLAPGVNIKRTPLCGRNFEYFSEDPFLTGKMAKAYVEGAQNKGIGACVKHFCCNNREYDRDHQSSEVDERTMREIYLPAFEMAIEADPWSIMCSYNPINGVYAAENSYLLNDVLRGEFGFKGIVISDWFAVRNSARSAKAGLDLEMPHSNISYDTLRAAYEKGWLTEEEIDVLVLRLLAFIDKKIDADSLKKSTMSHKERHQKSKEIALEGITLLKNEDGILPLRAGRVLVTGLGVSDPPTGGGGSSLVPTEYKQNHLGDDIKIRLGDSIEIIKDRSIFRYDGKMVRGNHAPFAAYDADTVIFCIGTDKTIEYEDRDRIDLNLPQAAEDMLIATTKVNKNVIVVLHSGSPVDMSRWIDKVKAVLYVGFAGEAANEATADILTGKVVPSGKLSETFPRCLEDTPVGSYRGDGFVDRYSEGIFVGYRYYDTYNKPVLFPFGHGLSYANFDYSDLKIDKHTETDYSVSFTITNTSGVTAKETAQLYVKDTFSAVSRPLKELRGFEKIELQPGETKRVEIPLNFRSFAYYNVSLKRWYVENGAFEIMVGASSQDIRLTGKINICIPEEDQVTFPIYNPYI